MTNSKTLSRKIYEGYSMSKLMHVAAFVGFVMLLAGCSIPLLDNPQVGMSFRSATWADLTESGERTRDKNPFYLYIGNYKGTHLYKRKPYWVLSKDEFSGSIAISDVRIVEVLSATETQNVEW